MILISNESLDIASPAQASDAKAPTSRRPELDGIRGLSILIVMAFYYLFLPLGEAEAFWAVAL